MPDSAQFMVEYLPRIGTTSIVLQGFKEVNLKHFDTGKLEVENEQGRLLKISLPFNPGKVISKSIARVGENEYSLTLKSDGNRFARSSSDVMTLPQVKWTKSQLSSCSGFKLACIQCNVDIIDQQNCTTINEMPSEFWAELMDYWHCHKPEAKTSGFYSLQKNSLRPCLNEVLIGESFFQAHQETLRGRVQVKDDLLLCSNCASLLGKLADDQMYKIYKWRLRLSCAEFPDDTFPPEQEIISTLLNCNRANSTRYILLTCGKRQLFIWLFAVGIEVTLPSNKILRKCLKILYTADKKQHVGLKTNVDEEEVNLIPFENFINELKIVNSALPASKRKFGSWNVSYFPMAD